MKITVNGLNWKIVFTNKPEDLELNGTIRLGITDRNKQTVYISNNIFGKLLEKVLLHEFVHVWLFSYGYELDVELEEMLCEFVDTYVYDIINTLESLLYEDNYVLKGVYS